jgi:hypothetical protein
MICLTRRALGPFGALCARRAFRTLAPLRSFGCVRSLFAILVTRITAGTFALRTIATLVAIQARLPLGPIAPILPLLTFRPLIPIRPVATFGTVVALGTIVVRPLLVVAVELILVTVIVVELFATLRALFFEPGAALAEHAEIMIRELQIIFRLDTVARELGVTRHALIFL